MTHTFASMISMICLTIVGLLCITLTLAHSVKDNIIERVGFMLLCMGCLARAWNIWRDGAIEWNAVLLHFGVATVFVGSAWAKFCNWRRQCRRDGGDKA
jgi:hypothetical protein